MTSTRGVRGEECRVRECRKKVRCRDRMADGNSVERQACRRTAELDLATCYHAETNMKIILKYIPVDNLEFNE